MNTTQLVHIADKIHDYTIFCEKIIIENSYS